MKFDQGRNALLGLGRVSVVAAAYYILGRLGLLLAIPPGYAAPVWPAAGLALGAVLLLGYRVWPGILVASFPVNIFTGFDSTTPAALGRSLALPLIISVGATAQALVGAFLIRRYGVYPLPLDRVKELFKTMTLGGPLSSLVSATAGCLGLMLTGAISTGEAPSNWWTWWVGDTVGILLFIPLVLDWKIELEHFRSVKRLTVAGPIVIGILLTLFLFQDIRKNEWEHTRGVFKQRVDPLVQAIKYRIASDLEILHAIHSLYAASDLVERDEFRAFARDALMRKPSIHALEWIPRLPDHQRSQYVTQAREQGFPDFQISELNAQGQLIKAARRDEYYPVYFLEPHAGNEKAFGFDLASNPQRRKAIDQATESGTFAATARVNLVQEKGNQFGLLIFLPVYPKGQHPTNAFERKQNLSGFVLGVFRVGDLIEAAVGGLESPGVAFRVLDTTAVPGESLLYASDLRLDTLVDDPLAAEISLPEATLASDAAFDMAGRKWALKFYATPAFFNTRRSSEAYLVITLGFLFTSLLGGFLLMVSGRAERTEQIVAERTAAYTEANKSLEAEVRQRKVLELQIRGASGELEKRVRDRTADLEKANTLLRVEVDERKRAQNESRRSASRFRRLIESAPDAIIIVDPDNRIRLANKQVEIVFGYEESELLGQPHDILLPKRFQEKHLQYLAAFFKNPQVRLMGIGMDNLIGRRKNGEEFPVDIALSPVKTATGIHTISTIRDITERKENESVLENYARELKAIYQLGKQVHAGLSPDQVCQVAVEGITTVISPDISMIYLKEGGKLLPQHVHAKTREAQGKEDQFHGVGECLGGLAAQDAKPVYSLNLQTDARCTRSECEEAGLQSFAAFPLVGKERVLGVLAMASLTPRDFSDRGEYLESLSTQVSMAMENVLFYQRIAAKKTKRPPSEE